MGNSEIITWISEATRRFWEDASVRMPRTEAERRNGMEIWLEQRRLKLGADLQEKFPHQFLLSEFNNSIWPQVKPEVLRYAIRGFAAAWVSGHMGDATTIGAPKRDGPQWRVPIGIKGYGDDLGQIVLNLDGEVIPEVTTTRSELLEAIREPSLSSLSAAAR